MINTTKGKNKERRKHYEIRSSYNRQIQEINFLKDFETKEEALKYARNHQFMYVDKIFVRNKETKEKVNNPYNPVIRVYKGKHLYIKGY